MISKITVECVLAKKGYYYCDFSEFFQNFKKDRALLLTIKYEKNRQFV